MARSLQPDVTWVVLPARLASLVVAKRITSAARPRRAVTASSGPGGRQGMHFGHEPFHGPAAASWTYVRAHDRRTYAMAGKKYTASELRSDVYRVLDSVLETGIPVEIERKGRVLRIVAEKPPSRLSRLVKRKVLNCAPDAIVHMDWSKYWKPGP